MQNLDSVQLVRDHSPMPSAPARKKQEVLDNPVSAAPSEVRGWVAGLSAYVMWVLFPLYFVLLEGMGAIEIIVHRAVWGLLICALFITFLRAWGSVRSIVRDRAVCIRLLAAGFFIVANWTIYVYAVTTHHVIDAAFGYFINPLVTVGLGVIVLKERLTRAQKTAVALGAASVLYLLLTLHIVPWISLILAFSFGLYGLVKKRVAHKVKPLPGMLVETSAMIPFLLLYYAILAVHGRTSIQNRLDMGDPLLGHVLLLVGAGVITVVPLLLFAVASKNVSLGTLGFMQYVNPVGQTLVGVYLMHEAMPIHRWVATGIVCAALVVLSYDALKRLQQPREE